MSEKIAFLQFGVFGDMLLATAICHDLRKQNPKAQITWIALDVFREVLAHNPDIDDYIAWPMRLYIERQHQEYQRWLEIKEYADHNFDRVVIPQCSPDHEWSLMKGVHLLDQMYKYAGITRSDNAKLRFGRYTKKVTHNTKLVTCNSRSGTQAPVWDDDQWSELWSLLDAEDIELYNGDHHTQSLSKWHDKIRSSACYIGLDSGGSWLAATTQTPQLAMYLDEPTCPKWLTSVKTAGVKADDLVTEMGNPTPAEVAKWIALNAS